jgi:hypothetical protein
MIKVMWEMFKEKFKIMIFKDDAILRIFFMSFETLNELVQGPCVEN